MNHPKTIRDHTFYILLVVFFSLFSACNSNESSEYSNKNERQTINLAIENTFAGAAACKECHSKQFSEWENSHHAHSMEIATQQSVRGDFNNVSFQGNQSSFRFFLKDGFPYVETTVDDSLQSFRIEYTFGYEPLQQYIVAFPNGKFQCLRVAWDTQKKVWFELQKELDIQPEEWLHWTKGAMNWNSMCADCHSTDLHKNYNFTNDSYNTTFSEINVACEACHGPASEHANYYQSDKKGPKPELLMKGDLSSVELVDQCARCHSRRMQMNSFYNYEGWLEDHYVPELLLEGIYQPDGQVLDEDYVYGSFLQSKMYHNGVSCKDCHDSHSLKLKKEGNQLCLQCHENVYDSEQHHFHPGNTEGSKCINCHMSGRLYMTNDFRRDHSFRIPRPDQSVKYGTSNACTECHTGKSNQWAAQTVEKWYGPNRADHFSDHLMRGTQDGEIDELYHLISNANYPAIARSTALHYYGSMMLSMEDVNRIKVYLGDSSGMVRAQTVQVLGETRIMELQGNLTTALSDSIRLVRVRATEKLEQWEKAVPESNRKEYETLLNENMEFASGLFNKAVRAEVKGNFTEAKSFYEKALKTDYFYNPARMNLALLEYKQGNKSQSEQLYKEVMKQQPVYAEPYYMLGLLYNEQNQLAKAMEMFKAGCKLESASDRMYYNYALILEKGREHHLALEVLKSGLNKYPKNEDLLYVKLLAEMELNRTSEAKKTIAILLQVNPQNQRYIRIYQDLNQR